MEEKIVNRIAELEQLEAQVAAQLNAIRGALSELRDILAPALPIMSGDPLGADQNGRIARIKTAPGFSI
jgi:hypothetical protein